MKTLFLLILFIALLYVALCVSLFYNGTASLIRQIWSRIRGRK